MDFLTKVGIGTQFDQSTIIWFALALLLILALVVLFVVSHIRRKYKNPSRYSPALLQRWVKKMPAPEVMLKVWNAANDAEKTKIGELAANEGWAYKYIENLGKDNGPIDAIYALWDKLQLTQDDILKELVETTANPNPAKSMAAVDLLKRICDERSIPLLLVALLQRDKYLPARICEALLPFGEASGRALAALFDKVNGEDALIVMDSLGQMGKYCPLNVLVQAMHSDDIMIRQRVASNIPLVKPDNVISFMDPLLNDKEPKVRAAAAAALAEIGNNGEHQEVIPVLKNIFQTDQDWQVKTTCQTFLSRWEEEIMAEIAIDEAHLWLKDEEIENKPRGTFAERYPEDK